MKFYLSIVLMALSGIFISCKDDIEGQDTVRSQVPISFVLEDYSATRGSSLSTISEFTVYAYDSDGKVFINGAQFYADGKSKNGKNYYWPTSGSLTFYAFTPTENANLSVNDNVLSYTVPTDNSAQIDLMTAKAENQTKATNGGVVKLSFAHVLSKVSFKGYTSISGQTAEIESITLHNVNSVMATGLDGTTATAPTPQYVNYSLGMSNTKAVTSADANKADNLTADDGAMLLVPQTLTPWSGNTTTAAADAANQSYLEVSCKIRMGSHYFVGSSTGFGKSYIPMSSTFEGGKSYVFNLCFDGPIIKIGIVSTVPEQSEAKKFTHVSCINM